MCRHERTRQRDDFFRVMAMLTLRYNDSIGDEIIHEFGADGAGEAEIIRLNRGRPMGKNPGTAALGKAHQVDGDVRFDVLHERRDVRIALPTHVDEAVKGTREARPHRTAVVGTEGYRHRL